VEDDIDDDAFQIWTLAMGHPPDRSPLQHLLADCSVLNAILQLSHSHSQHSTAMSIVNLGGGMNGGEDDANGHVSGNEQNENDAQQLGRGCRLRRTTFWQPIHERR